MGLFGDLANCRDCQSSSRDRKSKDTLETARPWFTQNLENLENLEKSWKKNHSGKLLEISWKNDLTLEK